MLLDMFEEIDWGSLLHLLPFATRFATQFVDFFFSNHADPLAVKLRVSEIVPQLLCVDFVLDALADLWSCLCSILVITFTVWHFFMWQGKAWFYGSAFYGINQRENMSKDLEKAFSTLKVSSYA